MLASNLMALVGVTVAVLVAGIALGSLVFYLMIVPREVTIP